MAFDGNAFVDEMKNELISSGRGLMNATWIEKVSQGEATKEYLVGWARQHYWGVTYHTRRFLSIWVGRIPYEMTDDVIDNISEEVLGTEQKKLFGGEGKSHLDWLFHFTRALGAPDETITSAIPNADAVLSESLLFNYAHQRPWYEMIFGALMAIEEQIPEAYTKVVKGFEEHYSDILKPDDYKFHTVHIVVDEDHGGGMGEMAEKYLDTEEKRRSARASYFAGAESARRCWDAFDGVSW